MSTRARYLRAAGAVLNGSSETPRASKALGFRLSAADYTRKQGRRQVIDFRVGIEIEGVRIAPAISSSATARASSSFPPKWRLRRSSGARKGVDREPGRNRHPPRQGGRKRSRPSESCEQPGFKRFCRGRATTTTFVWRQGKNKQSS